ncbi:MAG: FlgD immunoglobulin-like domain containing protein [Chthoniobacterales bacterium]
MAFLPLVKRWSVSALLALALTAVASGQESPTPSTIPEASPSATVGPARTVHFRFVPPPLEGTISLGIYDNAGKLVRVLRREADLDEFDVGSDALSTTWDGNDDAGQPLPAGKYQARGYAVGEIGVDGVAFFFNDWVTDENSPHLLKVYNLKVVSENELAMLVTLPGGERGSAKCNRDGDLSDEVDTEHEDERFLPERSSVRATDGKLSFQRARGWETVDWPDLVAPQSAAAGKDGTAWVIDRVDATAGDLALKQFSPDGTFLRQMIFAPGDPAPKVVTASTVSDQVFLLEESAAVQRVRGLTLVTTNAATDPAQKAISDWKVEFEKQITAHQRFAVVGGKPMIGPDPPSVEHVTIKLRSNPLEKDHRATVEVAVGYDEDGSFLKTADGLPLQTISETSDLKRILLSPKNEKSIDVFQDDDAVVEQFRVNALDQMMAFDAGEIELK